MSRWLGGRRSGKTKDLHAEAIAKARSGRRVQVECGSRRQACDLHDRCKAEGAGALFVHKDRISVYIGHGKIEIRWPEETADA